MTNQPEWVPKWAWNEYVMYVNAEPQTETYATKIVLDRGCEKVWPSLLRHQPAFLKTFQQVQTQHPDYQRETGPRAVVDMFEAIGMALFGPSIHEVIPANTRKRQGKRIARLAKELVAALREVADLNSLPPPFFDPIRDAVEKFIQGEIDQKRKTFIESADAPPELQWARDPPLEDGGRSAHLYGWLLMNFGWGEMLEAIQAGANLWSNSEPVLYRPSGEGASRQYFLIAMTQYFRLHYETPLREITADLARCLFGDEIDAATVSKLAP